jgi:hypothetical protein
MKILEDVINTVGDRQKDYSSFAETMNLTADFASKVLKKELTGSDVAMIYAINKIVRARGRKLKRDNILDGIAYLAIIDELEKLE